MPTDEERREVARKLRYVGEHGGPEWETAACCIAECIGEDDYPLWDGSTPIFTKLADLIEPRACRKVPGKVKYGRRMPACSECGYSLGDKRWNFCPKCGCEVIVDAY